MNEQFVTAARNMFPANEQYINAMKNMLPNNEYFKNALRANLEAQIAMLTALTTTVFESIEKVVDLNLNAGKTSLEESAATAKQLLSAKDPQEFLSLTVAQAQPTVAKAIAYSRHLAGIAATAQAEFSRITEEQLAEKGRKVAALVDEVSKNAPAGSENAMAIMQTAIRNASAGYEQFSKTTKQAVEVTEANLTTAVNQFSQSGEQTAGTTGRNRRR
jgi:phasin family protein